jgi:DNA-binding transcriptional LysR family regulator
MNPVNLKTFLKVREHLNYTRAAEEIFLSQPAVSRQIRQLEHELGVRLFEQIGKSLRLTDAGETLAGHAGKILGAMERTAEAVRAHRSAERGRLRIGASSTPGLYLLPSLLGRFHARFPQVEIDYAVESSLRVQQMTVHNEIDLGYVGAHVPIEELRMEPIVDDEIVCFAAPSHHLARRRKVSPQSLHDETWVIREKGSATRQLFESWLAQHGGQPGRAIELHSPEAVKALVAAGVGFSFMSVHGLEEDFRRQRLRKLNLSGLRLKRPIYLIRHADKHDSPVMEAFLDIVREVFPGYRSGRRSG